MTDKNHQVIFKGQIAEGQDINVVKQKLTALFKMNPKQVEAMFSGKPVYIKKNVDAATAKKYQSAIEKAGAVVEVMDDQTTKASSAQAATPAAAPKTSSSSSASPDANSSSNQVTLPGDNASSEIPDTESPQTSVPMEIPASFEGLDMAETGVELQTTNTQETPTEIPDISNLSMSEMNSGPLSSEKPEPVLDIDTSSLSLED